MERLRHNWTKLKNQRNDPHLQHKPIPEKSNKNYNQTAEIYIHLFFLSKRMSLVYIITMGSTICPNSESTNT